MQNIVRFVPDAYNSTMNDTRFLAYSKGWRCEIFLLRRPTFSLPSMSSEGYLCLSAPIPTSCCLCLSIPSPNFSTALPRKSSHIVICPRLSSAWKPLRLRRRCHVVVGLERMSDGRGKSARSGEDVCKVHVLQIRLRIPPSNCFTPMNTPRYSDAIV